jgi:hypothetical protein
MVWTLEHAQGECANGRLAHIGAPSDQDTTKNYWWRFVTEGVEVGQSIEKALSQHRNRESAGLSMSTTESQATDFSTSMAKC